MIEANSINKWIVINFDRILQLSQTNPELPSAEFIEKLRVYSFDNPNTGILLFSGAKDKNLVNYYDKVFKPNEEGKIPKIVIAPQNGSFLRVSTNPQNVCQQGDPVVSSSKAVSKQLDSKTKIIEKLANHDTALRTIFGKSGMLTSKPTFIGYYGSDSSDLPALNVLNKIINSGALEGVTLLSNNYSSEMPNHILKTKEPNDPIATNLGDSFYVLGRSKASLQEKISASEQEFFDFFNQNNIEYLNTIRTELKELGLLPSQFDASKQGLSISTPKNTELPPIVVLPSGAILFLKAECYNDNALAKLLNWRQGKVILKVNGADLNSLNIKQLVLNGENKNLIAVSPNGHVYVSRGENFAFVTPLNEHVYVSSGEYTDCERQLNGAKMVNEIVSANPDISHEIKLLRALEEVLIAKGFLNKAELSNKVKQKMPTSDNNHQKMLPLEGIEPLVPHEKSVKTNFNALAKVPSCPEFSRVIRNKRLKRASYVSANTNNTKLFGRSIGSL